jgi:hypothetical protein
MHPGRRQPCKPPVPSNRPENQPPAEHLRPPALHRFARARPSRKGSSTRDGRGAVDKSLGRAERLSPSRHPAGDATIARSGCLRR